MICMSFRVSIVNHRHSATSIRSYCSKAQSGLTIWYMGHPGYPGNWLLNDCDGCCGDGGGIRSLWPLNI